MPMLLVVQNPSSAGLAVAMQAPGTRQAARLKEVQALKRDQEFPVGAYVGRRSYVILLANRGSQAVISCLRVSWHA